MDARTYERLLVGIKTGRIRLDRRTYMYRNTANAADMDAVTYEAADRGWVTLPPGQDPQITDAGERWLAGRYQRYGVSPTRPASLAPNNASVKANAGPYRGERVPTARLTAQQVRAIKARLDAGERPSVIARDYGVGQSTVREIRAGKTWKHITPAEVP